MRKIQFIVGTVMGTAQRLAEYLQKQLSGHYAIDVNLNPSIEDLTRDENELLIFCTSNTGNGDLPDNINPL